MHTPINALRVGSVISRTDCLSATWFGIALLTALSVAALGQAPAPEQLVKPLATDASAAPSSTESQSTPPATPVENSALVPTATTGTHTRIVKNPLLTAGAFSVQTVGGEIREDQLKQLLVGKVLYLRAGYLDNNLEFDEWGRLTGHSPTGSFTLSQIQIDKVKLSKRKLELQGERYGLHFLGAAPYEDPTKATDRVKITPKKKTLRIAFDREQVEKPKKEKHKKKQKASDDAGEKESDAPPAEIAASAPDQEPEKPAESRSSDDKTTRTTDPAHASQLLLTALDIILSPGIDDRMIAAMPAFWQLYYKAAADKTDYRPTNPGVFFQNTVDQKAKLVSALDPPSNEFAQASGVAGMALYHTVIGSDGKAEQVVAGRPIGFGLDENAEQTIRKATFQPAIKDGKPVPVALDLVVSFRIYSKRTSQQGTDASSAQESKNKLPGLYTVQAMEQAQADQQNQPAPPAQPPAATATPQ